MYTHRGWPAQTVERALGYVFTLFLALTLALLVAAASKFNSSVGVVFGALTAAEILIIPVWFDVIILQTSESAPMAHIIVYSISAVFTLVLLIVWIVLAALQDSSRLFKDELGTTLTILLSYAMMIAASGGALWYSWRQPVGARVRWDMKIPKE